MQHLIRLLVFAYSLASNAPPQTTPHGAWWLPPSDWPDLPLPIVGGATDG